MLFCHDDINQPFILTVTRYWKSESKTVALDIERLTQIKQRREYPKD